MKNAVQTQRFARGATKTLVTGVGMTGTIYGSVKLKEFVRESTDNELLGVCAGVSALLLGSVLTVAACGAVDRALCQSTPLVIDVAPDNLQVLVKEPEYDLEDLEGNWDD